MHLLRRLLRVSALRLFVALDLPPEARAALAAFRDAAATRRGLAPGRRRGAARHARVPRARPAGGRRGRVPAVLERGRRRRRALALGAAAAAPAAAPARAVRGAARSRRRARRAAGARQSPGSRPPASTRRRRGRSGRTPRSRGCGRAPGRRARRPPAAPQPLAFHGEALTLYRSRLHPHGARYEPLVRVALAPPSRNPRPELLRAATARVQSRSDGRAHASTHSSRSPLLGALPALAGRRVRRPATSSLPRAAGRAAPRCACRWTARGAPPGEVPLRIARLRLGGRPQPTLVYLSGGPGGAGHRGDALGDAARPAARDALPHRRLRPARDRRLRPAALPGARARPAAAQRRRRARTARAGWARARTHYRRPTRSRTSRRSAQALGVERLTLFGISYGTELALAYARAHPDRVDRMILDSVVDPDDRDPFGLAGFRAMAPTLARAVPARAAAGITADPAGDLARARRAAAGEADARRRLRPPRAPAPPHDRADRARRPALRRRLQPAAARRLPRRRARRAGGRRRRRSRGWSPRATTWPSCPRRARSPAPATRRCARRRRCRGTRDADRPTGWARRAGAPRRSDRPPSRRSTSTTAAADEIGLCLHWPGVPSGARPGAGRRPIRRSRP